MRGGRGLVVIVFVRSNNDMDGVIMDMCAPSRTRVQARGSASRTETGTKVWAGSRGTRPRDEYGVSRDVYGGGKSTDFFCGQWEGEKTRV